MMSNLHNFKNTPVSVVLQRGKKLLIVSAFALSLVLVGCGSKPMSDADMASQYGMSMEEYQEQKEAAARMNMSIEDHLKNSGGGSMDMDMDM